MFENKFSTVFNNLTKDIKLSLISQKVWGFFLNWRNGVEY